MIFKGKSSNQIVVKRRFAFFRTRINSRVRAVFASYDTEESRLSDGPCNVFAWLVPYLLVYRADARALGKKCFLFEDERKGHTALYGFQELRDQAVAKPTGPFVSLGKGVPVITPPPEKV